MTTSPSRQPAGLETSPARRDQRRAGGGGGEIPVVLTQGLTKVFRDFWMRPRARAVDSLDMEIRQGEIFGLLGPNGSGKSTTIKILLGLLRKTSGFVGVFGKPPTDVQVKKRIGVLPEDSHLYPFLDARETLDYYGKLFELDHRTRKRRTDELLDMVGLSAVAHRQVREYSKGMQRRIGLAQALINDPDFLILDEPTAGLDPIGTRQVKDLILELGRRGKTILLSSHLLSDVEDVVDRMIILYGGRKRAEGTCDSLLVTDTRMTIETDALSDDVIEEIDRVLQQRAGSGVRRVAKPRQRLEELFMDIVERARADRVETSGAEHGGATAAFLRDQAEGEDLIERLTRAEPTAESAAQPEAETPEPESASTGPDDSVIESLVDSGADGEDQQRADRRGSPSSASDRSAKEDQDEAAQDVDAQVISSLLNDSQQRPDQGGGGQSDEDRRS